MKILFLLPEYYPHSGGGISTYYGQYIKALRPYCTAIKVIVGSGFTQSDNVFDHDGISVEYLKPALYQKYLAKFTSYDLLPGFKRDIAAAWAMWEQARQADGFDLVECTDFSLGFIPWVIHHTKPVVTRLHGSSGQISQHEDSAFTDLTALFYKQAELLLLPLCDRLISHSEANRQFWNDTLKSNKVIKINPVYDCPGTLPDLELREDFGMVTARLQRWKGPVELCKAYDLLSDPKPLVKWFGRDTPYAKGINTGDLLLRDHAHTWGKNIVPYPPLSHARILEVQRKAKFGLVPSTWDMFNFSCVEFMAAGLPVICSDGAGVADLIDHDVNGFRYNPNDTVALANCIRLMQNISQSRYVSMANAAFEKVRSSLSPDVIIPDNLTLYRQVLSSFKPVSSNVYFDTLYQPSDHQYTIDSILDKQPLKKLSRYYLKRLKQKIFGK